MPWHNDLPNWTLLDVQRTPIGSGQRRPGLGSKGYLATLQTLADAGGHGAKPNPDGKSKAIFPCLGGDRLQVKFGISRRTFWRHIKIATERGHIVILRRFPPLKKGERDRSRCGHRKANVYGFPGFKGELDRFRAKNCTRAWDNEDTKKIRLSLEQSAARLERAHPGAQARTPPSARDDEACHGGTEGVPPWHGRRATVARKACHRGTLRSSSALNQMDLFQDGTKPPADKEPAPAAKQTTASDSQGESKLSRIADHKVLSDFPALLALYHRQKAEGRINCTPRQFFAAAICARNEVQINGGDELAFFAWIVNGARWGSISDDGTWQSAQQALDGAVRQRDDRHYVTAVKSLAARFGNDPFHVARKHRPQLTREEWDGIESGAAGP